MTTSMKSSRLFLENIKNNLFLFISVLIYVDFFFASWMIATKDLEDNFVDVNFSFENKVRESDFLVSVSTWLSKRMAIERCLLLTCEEKRCGTYKYQHNEERRNIRWVGHPHRNKPILFTGYYIPETKMIHFTADYYMPPGACIPSGSQSSGSFYVRREFIARLCP